MRKIIHIDMDCFFAAVEVRENPALRGKPIAVGGSGSRRGVIATCSYEARKFGVHSAMPTARALKLCPQLILLPVQMNLYKEVSARIQALFYQYSDLVEPLSLDEAFIDVSNSEQCKGSATLIAQEILNRIYASEKLTASAGVASNKFIAKVASDWNKPNGLCVVKPDEVDAFVSKLPVKRIFGVGKVTGKRLAEMGVETCEDLQRFTKEALCERFGVFGTRLYELARGIDERPVVTHRVPKSLSVEETYATDLPSLESCLAEIPVLYASFLERLARTQKRLNLRPRTLFVKLRFDDFETTTIQMAGTQPSESGFEHLCEQAWQRGKRPVRLIGLGVQFAPLGVPEQLELVF
ncbi:DNA polymerase IV [Leucothrix sargassi]|nr:DNA polymerase IV [Leucothrix sargassi]